MATVQVTNSQNGFQPGLQPLVIVRDRDAANEYLQKIRGDGITVNEAFVLRRAAYEYATNRAGFVVCQNATGLQVHSLLKKDEWEELDAAIVEAVTRELNIVSDLRGLGLTQALGGLGTMVSQVAVGSEKVAASVSMSGRTAGDRDRVDSFLREFPVPIIHSEYEIGARELEAARRLGNAIDVTEATSSGIVVSEKIEDMVFDGETSILVGGATIPGLTTHSGRDTDTAANYGGGDFGTFGNGTQTILGMLSALAALNYRGPFGVYVSNTQYFEILTPSANRDGTDLSDIEAIPGVSFVRRSDFLPDGEVIVVQLSRTVIDIAVALEISNREWRSGDEMAFYGKVMGAMVPRLKQDFAGNVGVAHATGA